MISGTQGLKSVLACLDRRRPELSVALSGSTSDSTSARARTATGEERAELWQRIASKYKNYAGYQRNTNREIPVVVCEHRT